MQAKAEIHVRYPLSSLLIYNGATILHFMLGGLGLALGYSMAGRAAYLVGLAYLALSLAEMYGVMPVTVCPHCVYFRIKGSRCVSGLNLLSVKIARQGNPRDFPKRSQGLMCPNNLYLASLVLPALGLIPALILNFSLVLLSIFLALVALLMFRFLILFPRIACLHCRAKWKCPQAGAMGVRER